MLKKTLKFTFISVLAVSAVLLLPLCIGIWVPDVVTAPRWTLGEAEATTGHRFEVVQYWNRCDWYSTELVVTAPDGTRETRVLDPDDGKTWKVPIRVEEEKRQVTIILKGGRARRVAY